MIICMTSVGAFELPGASDDILADWDNLVRVIPLSCIACLVRAKSISTCPRLSSEEDV